MDHNLVPRCLRPGQKLVEEARSAQHYGASYETSLKRRIKKVCAHDFIYFAQRLIELCGYLYSEVEIEIHAEGRYPGSFNVNVWSAQPEVMLGRLHVIKPVPIQELLYGDIQRMLEKDRVFVMKVNAYNPNCDLNPSFASLRWSFETPGKLGLYIQQTSVKSIPQGGFCTLVMQNILRRATLPYRLLFHLEK